MAKAYPARLKVVHVVGARPNFMKAAPIVRAMEGLPEVFEQTLVHTGQHYDDRMSKVFFDELEMRRPDVDLGVGSGSHAEQTGRAMMAIEPVLCRTQPDWTVVVGDVNSTLAGALAAAKLGIPVVHVEAGLRSFDRTMPEEYNRLLTDQVADLLFTHSREADENLRREGIPNERIHFVGNVMIDSLLNLWPKASAIWPRVRSEHRLADVDRYVLVTLHRPSNVDRPAALKEILGALGDVADWMPVVFPVHPRTHGRIRGLQETGSSDMPGGIRVVAPLGYTEFLALERNAALVITDSGGVQEETTYLGVPCLTVRPNTERPVTVSEGTNRLVAGERSAIVGAARAALGEAPGPLVERRPPELWDGRAAERIVDILKERGPAGRPEPMPAESVRA